MTDAKTRRIIEAGIRDGFVSIEYAGGVFATASITKRWARSGGKNVLLWDTRRMITRQEPPAKLFDDGEYMRIGQGWRSLFDAMLNLHCRAIQIAGRRIDG